MSVIVEDSFEALVKVSATVGPATRSFSVSLPCIINTLPIEANKEVILKLKPLPEKKKFVAQASTAFDLIALQDKKQRRAKAQGTEN